MEDTIYLAAVIVNAQDQPWLAPATLDNVDAVVCAI